MNDDEARRIILSRRARFVAATLAGVGIAQGCGTKPTPAREPTVEIDAGPEPEPEPAASAEPSGTTDAAPAPTVCLEVAPRICLDIEPEVCLSVAPQVCLKPLPPPKPDAGTPKKQPPPRICLSEY